MTESKRKVSLLVPDIGSPTVGAALKLAGCLEKKYRTEIVGPDFGDGVCSLYKEAYPFTVVPAGHLHRFPDYWWERRRIDAALTGDVIIAVKAFADTVPVALAAGKRRGARVLVYLDEWDGALWRQKSLGAKARCWLSHAHHPMEECFHPWVERMIPRADGVLSTTTFLQKRFGGTVLHAGVDVSFFTPQPPSEVEALREKLGLRDCRVIVFGGVSRPHKGVEDILEALCRLGDPSCRLLIAGPRTQHIVELMRNARYSPFICVAGAGLHETTSVNADIHARIPLYLDAGDLVVLPLKDTLLAQSQMPIKLFEAMAMAKPIIATAVSDLPAILDGCGRIVRPNDPDALAAAIREVMESPKQAARMGRAARDKCTRLFSREETERQLVDIVDGVLGS